MKKNFLFLIFVVIIFFTTRLYLITGIPPSLYWDEASIGYNAYSILQTGKDEWGEFLPLHFRSFGEFKLPVYIYSVALTQLLIGYGELSVRLPAVFFSFGVISITFFLGLNFFKNIRLAILGVFLITISPWFFIFSRVGYEATAGLFFYLLGIYFFILSLNRYPFFILAVISFIISLYSYNSFRVIIPPLFIIFVFLFLKNHKYQIKLLALVLFISISLFIVSIIPIYKSYIVDYGSTRFQNVRLNNPTDFPVNYFSHFTPNFLLFGDKIARIQQPNFGQVYILDIIFLILGLIVAIKSRELRILILLMLIAPIPAAITREAPHALRAISIVPFLSLITVFGLDSASKKINGKIPFKLIGVVFYLAFFGFYMYSFLNNYSQITSDNFQYGYKRIFVDYKKDFSNYDKVIISDYLAQPYIFGLFYLKYDPNKFISEVTFNPINKWGSSTVSGFNNFLFTKVSHQNLPYGKLLIFVSPSEKIDELQMVDKVKNLDGSDAFFVYKVL